MRGAPVKEKNRRWLGHGGVRDVLPTQQMLAIARVDLLLLYVQCWAVLISVLCSWLRENYVNWNLAFDE